MNAPDIVFFTRKGCHLCDVAMDELKMTLGNRPFTLCKVDIDVEREHHDEYSEHVPVVWINGVEVCRHKLDRDRVLAAFATVK